MIRCWLIFILAVTGMVALPAVMHAQAGGDDAQQRTLITLGEWKETASGERQLLVDIIPHITQRQRELIESGFSTFSQLEIRSLGRDGELSKQTVAKINCTAKFDLWQEIFEIVRIDENPKAVTVKSFQEYARECFQPNFVDSEVLQDLTLNGGRLVASLFVDQISADKDEKIREWLIRQQSGVMQGLFSHMLGDLKLSQRIDVVIDVPRRPNAPRKKSA
jgi:hypothetical protein